MLKLKSCVVLKPINSDCVYAVDCESTEDVFFKFEGVSKLFIEKISTGVEASVLIDQVSEQFQAVPKTQIEKDLGEFLTTIQDFNILA